MSNRRYIIGTGFVNNGGANGPFKDEVMRHWVVNNRRYSSPRAVLVLSMHGSSFSHPDVKEINVVGNLGHCDDLLYSRKPHAFSGAAGAILTLAMVAYCDESDFIYKEQDSLCFGPWVERLYSELDDGGLIIGPNDPAPSGTALILMRHEWIPTIVSNYLSSRPERDKNSLVEHHFDEMANELSLISRRHTFGYDKRRPCNFEDETFWIQQPSREEIKALAKMGLI